MQLLIEKFIYYPQCSNKLPTHTVVFFDLLTSQFISVSREEFFNVIETSFPELPPLTKLFYHKANTVHHKWDEGTWRTLFVKEDVSQGCPLSPLCASFVSPRLLKPINSLLREQAAARLDSVDPDDGGFGGISHLLGYVDDISSCSLTYLSYAAHSKPLAHPSYVLSTHQKPVFSPHATALHPLSPSSTQPTPY